MELLIPEPAAADRFERLQAGFRLAIQRQALGVPELHYRFGGFPARLAVVGRAFAEHIVRPFLHLRSTDADAGSPRLDIGLWDENETGVRRPGEPEPETVGDPRVTEISSTGRFVLQRTPCASIGLDRASARIVGAVAWSDRVPLYERGKPLARLLVEWYADQGRPVMHGALVSRGDRGVILAGKGGSGKSTSALICARAGLGFLGEDYVGLELPDDRSVVGHSVYSSVFLTPATAAAFPDLAPHLAASPDPGEVKSLLCLADVCPSRLLRSVPVRAVALCRLVETPVSRVRPASRIEALRAVAPSSLLQIHGRRKDSLDRLTQLVERVPCFWLEQGRHLASVVEGVEEILARATT